MNLGCIAYTNSKDVYVNTAMRGFRPISLAEEYIIGNNQNNPAEISASILLPGYEAVSYALDRDIVRFKNLYLKHLASRECDEFIALVLMSAYRGNNSIIYINKDEMDLLYPHVLFEYIQQMFGYTIKNVQDPMQSSYNNAYDAVLLTKFFNYDFINPEEFLVNYPVNVNIPDGTIFKLYYEEGNPFIGNKSPRDYYLDKIKAYHGVYQSMYTRV